MVLNAVLVLGAVLAAIQPPTDQPTSIIHALVHTYACLSRSLALCASILSVSIATTKSVEKSGVDGTEEARKKKIITYTHGTDWCLLLNID